jgi:hypothetical protein
MSGLRPWGRKFHISQILLMELGVLTPLWGPPAHMCVGYCCKSGTTPYCKGPVHKGLLEFEHVHCVKLRSAVKARSGNTFRQWET